MSFESRRRRSRTGAGRPAGPSFADKLRRIVLGVGRVGIELAGVVGGGSGGDAGTLDASGGDSPRARTWYGRILQWAWALLVLLVGLACLAIAVLAAAAWVMSWFG